MGNKKRSDNEKVNDLKRSIRQQTENAIQDQISEIRYEAGNKMNSIGGESNWFDYLKTKEKIKKVKGKKTELLTYTQACYLLRKIDLTQYLFHGDASTGLRLDYLFDYNNNEIRIERKNIEKLIDRMKA